MRPKIRTLAKILQEKCREEGFSIEIARTLRTHEEQERLYAHGRTSHGKIVTRRKGGESFHNYGVAFDIRLVVLKEINEKKKEEFYKKAGAVGIRLGLEWGGNWAEFVDMPHFQYTAGYSIEDFKNNTVDWKMFDI
jgi:peptidoglycan L-alanyl-D-glutamate endopeptidase CwlK